MNTDQPSDPNISTIPEDAAPQDAAPEDAAPEDAAPQDTAPEDAAPEDTAPEDTAATDPATPVTLPLVPRWDTIIFPRVVSQFVVRNQRSQGALERAVSGDQRVVVVARRETSRQQELSAEDVYSVGTEATVGRVIRMPDGLVNVWLQGERRVQITNVHTGPDNFYLATAEPLEEIPVEKDAAVEATMQATLSLFEKYVRLSDKAPEEAYVMAMNADTPGGLADTVAASLALDVPTTQEVLELLQQGERLDRVSRLLARELDVVELQHKIRSEVHEGIDKSQREFFLREQLRVIQKELGQMDPAMRDADELREKMEQAGMPLDVQKRVQEELDRLSSMPSAHPEVTMVRTYVDWMVSLPWSATTEDKLDIKEAQQVLNENHYGLAKIKERIIEYMAVRQLAQERLRSPILCFVGPPGVGKTSLGKSIATALGRKFVRVSLGGIRDEAEVRGHRRTYIGALPGRIIQIMRTAGTTNPVFMLDELDKVGTDFRGDPSSALLEVLDPEQNHSFSDHYLEVPYNLSKVLFIATANLLDPILPALRDRLEVIELSGYTEREKREIARRFLVPKQLKEHGLEQTGPSFSQGALSTIIEDYTREAGVRNLEREIGNICRKIARKVAEAAPVPKTVTTQSVPPYLGSKRFYYGTAELEDQVGVATGVAKTEQGGDVLSIEVALLEGEGKLILTGQLGEVMRESAQAALSYARTQARMLEIDAARFEKTDVHIHVPAGGVPKDGPSAGITLATALISALTQQQVSRDVAMTGEITLRGRVLPIGGLKDKVLAAHRAGIRTFVAPAKNKEDLEDLPRDVRREMRFVWVEQMEEVLEAALRKLTPHPRTRRATPSATSRVPATASDEGARS